MATPATSVMLCPASESRPVEWATRPATSWAAARAMLRPRATTRRRVRLVARSIAGVAPRVGPGPSLPGPASALPRSPRAARVTRRAEPVAVGLAGRGSSRGGGRTRPCCRRGPRAGSARATAAGTRPTTPRARSPDGPGRPGRHRGQGPVAAQPQAGVGTGQAEEADRGPDLVEDRPASGRRGRARARRGRCRRG